MTDPTIDEVRKARRLISVEIGPGLAGLVDRYAKMESRFSHAPLTQKDRRTIKALTLRGTSRSSRPLFEKPD